MTELGDPTPTGTGPSPQDPYGHTQKGTGEDERTHLQAEPRPGLQPSFCYFQATILRGGSQGHLTHSSTPTLLSPWPETGYLDLNSCSSRQAGTEPCKH